MRGFKRVVAGGLGKPNYSKQGKYLCFLQMLSCMEIGSFYRLWSILSLALFHDRNCYDASIDESAVSEESVL